MAKDSARNEDLGCLYGIGKDGQVIECPVIKWTAKGAEIKVPGWLVTQRVYGIGWRAKDARDTRSVRDRLEQDGKVDIPWPGLAETLGSVLYRSRPTQALAVTTAPTTASDSARNDDNEDEIKWLWQKLRRADWSSSAAAYATASDARQIITRTGVTLAAFAAECKTRHISGFGSQGSVSRRLRWAELHDQLWEAGILPHDVFISEAACRPLFDGKLTAVQRLKLLAELFGQYLTEEARAKAAEALNEALMREHLRRHGQGEGQYTAPRKLNPEKVIAALLAQGLTADRISEIARHQEDSARNYAATG